ncbi:MAG: MATE family efflux transporter [Kiritimatiellae bacterium]|nr:MATE family efflux transporter [Kiritimatiellia bacterium]
MGAGRILPLILKYAWPAVVTMTINQLYNVVDRVYIGHGCGADAIAGLTLTFPIMGALGAVGVLIGMGSSSILSIRLGAGDRAGAEKALGSCVAMKLLFGLTVPPLMFFFGFRPILALMAGAGTTAETLRLAHQYLAIVIFFNIFAHLGFGLSATMRAEGSPRQSMYCMITGCATNIVLDPLFIFDRIPLFGTGLAIPGLGLRVAGAAWATNISMMVTCGTALLFYLRRKSVVRLRVRRVRVYRDITPKALAIGLSPCLMQIMGAVIGFSLNHAFAAWSATPEQGTIEISAFGIANTLSFLFFIPSVGVQQGLAPIIGYNWGAGNYRRVRECLVLGLKLTALATFAVFLGTELLPRIGARAFAKDPAVIAATVKALRISNIFIWTIFVNVAATTYFQAIGRPRVAILLSLLRQFICLLPLVWILPHLIGDHVLAVWLALPISDIVAQLATLPPLVREFRWLKAKIHEGTPS